MTNEPGAAGEPPHKENLPETEANTEEGRVERWRETESR